MNTFKNTLFQNAIHRTKQMTPPIWFMRQAGRYHSHYQKLKSSHTFMELCKIPELAAEVALGPVMDFDFDVSILFSDLLFPLEALGMGLEYTDRGPELGFSLNQENFSRLATVNEALPHLEFQKKAVECTRKVLPKNKSLIGFVGGPWTLFVYAVEGSHSGSMQLSKRDPGLYRKFSERMVSLLKANIQLQLDGGAELVMIFDTAAGGLSSQCFDLWVVPHLAELAKAFPGKLGYYSRETHKCYFSKYFLELPWAGQGFDHRWDLREAFTVQTKGFVQGNFDQGLLFLEKSDFKRALNDYIEPLRNLSPEQRSGWVCGLGHGVLPKTPEDNIRIFIETIRKEFSV
jgi:uroporphyrinogen decarboxylase